MIFGKKIKENPKKRHVIQAFASIYDPFNLVPRASCLFDIGKAREPWEWVFDLLDLLNQIVVRLKIFFQEY